MGITMILVAIGLCVVTIALIVVVHAKRLTKGKVEYPRLRNVVGRAATDKSFRAQVEDIFQLEKNRLLVSCTITNGQVEVGEIVYPERMPENSITIITIEQFVNLLDRACQGDRVSFCMENSPAAANLSRGDYLITSVSSANASDQRPALDRANTVAT